MAAKGIIGVRTDRDLVLRLAGTGPGSITRLINRLIAEEARRQGLEPAAEDRRQAA